MQERIRMIKEKNRIRSHNISHGKASLIQRHTNQAFAAMQTLLKNASETRTRKKEKFSRTEMHQRE